MQIRQLESFALVCETRSFARAAEQMYLTQPAISQQIRSLEKELGCELLEHHRHAVTLTRQGEIYYPFAKRIVETSEQAMRALSADAQTFYLHFINRSSSDPIQRRILNFYTEYPRCRIELVNPVPPDVFADASRMERCHLYLVQKTWLKDTAISFVPLGQARYACMLSPEDPLCTRPEVWLSEAKDRVFALVHRAFGSNGPFMHEVMERLSGLVPETRLEDTGDTSRTLARVISGHGDAISIMPYYVPLMDHSGVVRKPFRLEGDHTVGFAYVGPPSQPMREFLKMCKNCYEE